MDTIRCCKCGQDKPSSEFNTNRRNKSGLNSCCRECGKTARKMYRDQDRERNKDRDVYAAVFDKKCAGCGQVKPCTEFHRHATTKDGLDHYCKACASEQAKREDQDKVRARCKDWYRRNKDKPEQIARQAQNSKDYYSKHRDEIIPKVAAWCKANPEKAKAQGLRRFHRRKARLESAPYDLTQEQWEAILAVFNYSCVYCGKSGVKLEQEHLIPTVLGGGYTASNIVPACGWCNRIKAYHHPAEWIGDERYAAIKAKLDAISTR